MSSVWSIRRSTTDKKLAGVCGGVARHWNVDPLLVRVGWVLLALSGGVGIVLYIAAWLLVPADGAATSAMDDLTKGQTSSWPREAWVAIVAIACLVTFVGLGSATKASLAPAVVLALIWYFGYYKSRASHRTPPTTTVPPPTSPGSSQQASLGAPPAEPLRYPGPSTPFTQAAEAWRQRVEEIRRGGPGPSSPAPSSPTPPWPAPSSSTPVSTPVSSTPVSSTPVSSTWHTYPYGAGPSPVQDPVSPEVAARADFLATPDPVGLYTEAAPTKASAAPSRRTQARSLSARRLRLVGLVVLGLVLLGLAVADSLGAPITPLIYVASALLVVGLTLIAATWLGRARGILPIGVLLLLAVLGISLVQPAGELLHSYTYTSVGQFPATPVSIDRGMVSVDLRNLDMTSDATLSLDLRDGAIEIQAPPDAAVVLDYSVGAGMVTDNDQTVASGANQHGTATLQQAGNGQHTLTLDVDIDRGLVAVTR